MVDLRIKYHNLLNVMREQYKNDDGSELTFQSDNFAGRIIALVCLFTQYGVTDRKHFGDILGDDWTWGHYQKVLSQLQILGAVDEHNISIEPECAKIAEEIGKLYEGQSDV